MMNTTTRYYRYAVGLLALTVAAGALLRLSMSWPGMRTGLHGPWLVHAHSHAGFFGWAVLGVCGVIAARIRIGRTGALVHRTLAHGIGLGASAAFVGFALRGYDSATIALSALHVTLWIGFVAAVWSPIGALPETVRRYLRTALAFLVAAGLATTMPVAMMVRGVADAWLLQFGVKVFLTLFVTGFLLPAALGLLYERTRSPRHATLALAAIAAGALPSSVLYVAAPAPLAWLPWIGRAGMALAGAGLVVAAFDFLRDRLVTPQVRVAGTLNLPPLARLQRQGPIAPLALVAGAAAILTGTVHLLAAAGVGAAFMHNRNIVVGVLHLMLLGVVTPAFVLALRPTLRAPLRTAGYAGGLCLMLGALAAAGWPAAVRMLMQWGIPLDVVFRLAGVGGVVTTVMLLSLFVPGWGEGRRYPPSRPNDGVHASGRGGRRWSTSWLPASVSRRTRTPRPYSST
jgi:hypothetical protein